MVAALFDTTVGVLLMRRRTPEEAAGLIQAARNHVAAGTALLPAPAAAELLIGERTERGLKDLNAHLSQLPTVIVSAEAAGFAGLMGAFLGQHGAPIPYPDLLIAGTAIWLDVPLLTWDSDYARARQVAVAAKSAHAGALLWRRLELHPASRA